MSDPSPPRRRPLRQAQRPDEAQRPEEAQRLEGAQRPGEDQRQEEAQRPAERLYLCVKGIVRDPDGRLLLLKRTEHTVVDPGRWDLPGGKLDPGELFDDAFVREVREETGLDARITGVAGARDWTLAGRRVAYLFIEAVVEANEPILSAEHVDWAWVGPDEVGGYDLPPQFLGTATGLPDAKQ